LVLKNLYNIAINTFYDWDWGISPDAMIGDAKAYNIKLESTKGDEYHEVGEDQHENGKGYQDI